jgi:hypothetical protein
VHRALARRGVPAGTRSLAHDAISLGSAVRGPFRRSCISLQLQRNPDTRRNSSYVTRPRGVDGDALIDEPAGPSKSSRSVAALLAFTKINVGTFFGLRCCS